MKKKVFYIIISVISLGCLLDRSMLWGFKWNKEMKSSYISGHPINADILILGPCEAETMIDPNIVDSITGYKTFNLGLNHADFADNYLLLYLYLKHQKSPDYIFLYVTPESMDSVIANTFNTYRFIQFYNDDVVNMHIRLNDRKYAKVIDIPLLRFSYYSNFTLNKALAGWYYKLNDRQLPIRVNGYRPLYRNPLSASRIIDLSPKSGMYLWSVSREYYLTKILELCFQKNIKIYLYESPVFNPLKFRQQNRHSHMEKIATIASAYQSEYLIFDTLSMSNDSSVFLSSLYTNWRGSKEFSIFFSHYIQKNILKSGKK